MTTFELRDTMLRAAIAAEPTNLGTGNPSTTLGAIRTQLLAVATNNGRLMTSVSGGGKSYAFTGSYSLGDLTRALDQAERLWVSWCADQLNALVNTPIITRAKIGF